MKAIKQVMFEESLRSIRQEDGMTLKELAESLVEVMDESELKILLEQLYAASQSKE